MNLSAALKKQHSHNSSLRENIVEHILIGEFLRLFWRNAITDVEILRSEFDAYGYDLVISHGVIVRHLQLKTGVKRPTIVSVQQNLANRPSGCVLYAQLTDQLDMGPFFWCGNSPGEPIFLPENLKITKRTSHNKAGERPERIKHRQLTGKYFERIETLSGVAQRLLGMPLDE